MSTAVGASVRAATDGLAPGAQAGPWIVERELGSGGMGIVYEVVHREIGKRAALKIVHGRALHGTNAERMLIEARVVNRIRHPNIVDIFEAGRLPDGRPYIVMERLEGQSLARRADERKLLPDQVIAILLQICEALEAAHANGVIHRDLKLDNVFLVDNPEDAEAPRVKLLDWGIAKQIHDDPCHTLDGQLVGTPQYLSPEQARGAAVSPQTDVYSLGVMAWELFLEELPFEAETAAEVMAMHLRATPAPASDVWPEIPARLEELLHGMLAKSPSARPTVAQVRRRLEAVQRDLRARCGFLSPGSWRSSGSSHAPGSSPSSRSPGSSGSSRSSRPSRSPGSSGSPSSGSSGSSRSSPSRSWRSSGSSQSGAWQPRPRRWKLAFGSFALVAGTTVFLLGRSPDSSANASAPFDGRTSPTMLERLELVDPPPAPPVLRGEPAHAVALPAPGDELAPSSSSVDRTMTAPTNGRARPAAPRRRALAADGTLDPYR